MGSRANIVVYGDSAKEPPVYLYTHWNGNMLPEILALALSKYPYRWGDAPYLTRIIFDVLSEGEHGTETGFGISAGLCANDHDLLVVVPYERKVYVSRFGGDPDIRECGIPFDEVTPERIRKEGWS